MLLRLFSVEMMEEEKKVPVNRHLILVTHFQEHANNREIFDPIVENLLSKTQDLDEMQAVIFSHEHFGKSEILLSSLIKQYRVLAAQDLDTFRVINFIKNWIKIEKPKFTNQMRELGTMLV